MRILLINDVARYLNGGGNRVVVETLEGLHARGMTVGCVYHSGDAQLSPGIWSRRVEDRQPAESMRTQMLQAIEEFQPDLIQSHSTQVMESYPDWVDRIPSAQFVHDESWFCSGGNRVDRNLQHCHRPHGLACLPLHYTTGCGGRSPMGNWVRWRLVASRLRARGYRHLQIQVASRFMRRGFLENGFPENRLTVIPLYSTAPAVELPMEPGLIVAPARLVHHKGIDVLIRALHGLRDIPWRLAVPGDGPERERLTGVIRELGIEDRVVLPGELHPDEVDRWYARAQLVAFPVLREEPFGLVGVEALAHGKPIVAFAGGAVEEWLWPGETGVSVTEKTPEALGKALGMLLRDPDRCLAMGQAARTRYTTFTRDAYLDRLLAHFTLVRNQFLQIQPQMNADGRG